MLMVNGIEKNNIFDLCGFLYFLGRRDETKKGVFVLMFAFIFFIFHICRSMSV